MRRLELHYQEHQQHNSLYQECQEWAERTREKLNECGKPVSTLADAQSKLQTVKALRQSLETGQNKLRYTLELKEKVILNTEKSGATKIQEDTENLKAELDRLFTDVDELRIKLTNRVAQLEDLKKNLKLLTDWLDETESKANGTEAMMGDLNEKKALLERFKILQKDVNGHDDFVEKIKAKVKEDSELMGKDVENSFTRFNNLKNIIKKRIEEIEREVIEHEKYKQAYTDACEWVRKTRLEVQQYSDPHGEEEEALKKKSKLDEIVKTLKEGEALINKPFELKDQPLQHSSPEGQENIKQELGQLRNDWNSLNSICKDSQKNLSKCISLWKVFDETYKKMNDWISKSKEKVEVQEKEIENRKPENLKNVQNLLEETNKQKVVLEELNDRCENLMDMCACPWVREKTVQLQGEYTRILTSIQSLLSRLQKKLSDHTEFINARDEFNEWLSRANGSVQKCSGHGDEAETAENLGTVNLVSQRLTEGQMLLNKVHDMFAKAVETAPGEEQDELRNDVITLNSQWENFNMDISTIMAELKATLARYKEFKESQVRLEKWLTATEETLKEPQNTKGDLGEMKTAAERLKNIQGEIDHKGNEVERLVGEAHNLSKLAAKPDYDKKAQELKTLWQGLCNYCKNLRNSLDSEMADHCTYHQQLQDIEKWVLQISFQLMAHNSLYITNKEQTEEQISHHENLMNEIEKYQVNLNNLKEKGEIQIQRYKVSTTGIEDTIKAQLKNVQDSYDSLLSTAGQIKNRLLESLAKFKEYEDALELITKNLDVLEPKVFENVDLTICDLKHTQSQLDSAKNLNNKLQSEKNRLMTAVQACEAATACVSRPSSPLEAAPPSTPEKELLIRARLDDMMDYLQSRFININQRLAELKKWKKERDLLSEWIIEQRKIVSDWNSSPTKLRFESCKQDISEMNALLPQISEKRNKILTELPQDESKSEPDLENLLNVLEEELMKAVAKKEKDQKMIENYRKTMANTHKWLDANVKKVENLEKGNAPGLDCNQKLSGVKDLLKEFDTKGLQKVENVVKESNKVTEVVSNLDSQLVEEQIKSLQRKYDDIYKRIERKAQGLESTNQTINGIREEVQQLRDWIKENLENLKNPEFIGYQSKPVKDKISSKRALVKEVDGKRIIIESLDKRLGQVAPELEPKEVNQLEIVMKAIPSEHGELYSALKEALDKLQNAYEAREKFEDGLDTINNWIKNKAEHVSKIGMSFPLKSFDVQRQITECKEHIADIKKLGDTVLNNQEKLANSFGKDCSDEDKKKLEDLMTNIKNNFGELLKAANEKLSQLSELLVKRKEFENKVGKCEKWLDEAQIVTANEIRSPNIGVVEEQLNNYEKLKVEADEIGKEITAICEETKTMVPLLNDADNLILQTQLNTDKDKHARLLGVIKDRCNNLTDIFDQHKSAAEKIKESVEFIKRIQNLIKELNRPVGATVDEVQAMINSYEKILGEVKDHRGQLDCLRGRNYEGIENIVTQEDALIKAIEDQIARLRLLYLLREQYMGLIQQITIFITKYTEIVKDIEKSGESVQEKIRRYDDASLKVQECDALLALATDKGQQIATEGSVTDRNNVTETLTSLKQQLQQLRKAIERQREIHEESLAAYGKLVRELDEILDSLSGLESDIKGRPLLKREPESVDEEIKKHKVSKSRFEVELFRKYFFFL